MTTAFLVDVSERTSIAINQGQARYIVRAFRPDDIVLLFDHRSIMLEFLGNPTYNDIMNMARPMNGPCTGLGIALVDAERISPGSRKIILTSQGRAGFPNHPHEEIIFDPYGRQRK